MKYTDKELIRASQVAYFTLNKVVLDEALTEFNKSNQNVAFDSTLSELYKYSKTFNRAIFWSMSRNSKKTLPNNVQAAQSRRLSGLLFFA